MYLQQNCKEFFLDGVTEVRLFPVENSKIPIPYSVPQLLEIKNCQLPTPLLHFSVFDERHILAENLSVKIEATQTGMGMVFNIGITSNLPCGADIVREVRKKIYGKDFYPVLTTRTGDLQLCYTLPRTFKFDSQISTNEDSKQCDLSISLKSLSEPIPITILS